jgi:hypothetical protein
MFIIKKQSFNIIIKIIIYEIQDGSTHVNQLIMDEFIRESLNGKQV